MKAKMQFAIAVVVVTALGGSVFAYDSYYYQDSVGDHDLANRLNWTLNGQTTVPETFPPAVDTTTSGGTHPRFYFNKAATLSLPNQDALDLNDLIFSGANAAYDIDLGSADKTLSFFGCGDAAVWVGQNSPNGQVVTLKEGTLTVMSGTLRKGNIRLGGSVASRGNLAAFIADGSDACVSGLSININAGNTLVSFRNGAKFYNSNKDGLSISTGVSNAVFEVTGEGSCWINTNRGINPNFRPMTSASSGLDEATIRVTDGGVVSNMCGAVGSNGYGTRLWLDRGRFYADNTLTVGSTATANHNLMYLANGSYCGRAQGVTSLRVDIGGAGYDNRMEVYGSTLDISQLSVGTLPGAHDNSVLWSNVTLSASCSVSLGGYPSSGLSASYVTNSTMVIEDSFIGTDTDRPLSITVASTTGCYGNRLDVRRSTIHFGGSYAGVGGATGSSTYQPDDQSGNVLCVDDHSTVDWKTNANIAVNLGSLGHSNRLEVVGGSSLAAYSIGMGSSSRTENFTTGNSILVGADSTVTAATYLNVHPCKNTITISNGTFVAGHYINWHTYYSKTQGKTATDLSTAEADGVVFDTTLRFIGTGRFTSPSERDVGFDASHLIEFDLPSEPSANPIINGSANVSFNGVKGYKFDFRSIGKDGGEYVLAKAAGTLTVKAADQAALTAALAAAETASRNFKATLLLKNKQLIVRVRPIQGFVMVLR